MYETQLQTVIASQPKPKEDVIDKITDQMIAEGDTQAYRIRSKLATLEKLMGYSWRGFLGFGSTDKQIDSFTCNNGGKYYGEKNERGGHGRGITVQTNGSIFIGFSENGQYALGNRIQICAEGQMQTEEMYLKQGK